MAGMPKRKAIVDQIEIMGGEEELLNGIMDGVSLSSMCKSWGVSRGMMYWWLHRDDERWDAFLDARKLGAYSIADDIHVIEEGMTDKSVFVDRERVRIKQWLAERANRQAFGKQDNSIQVGVVITAASLHLQAHEELNAIEAGECISVEDMMT